MKLKKRREWPACNLLTLPTAASHGLAYMIMRNCRSRGLCVERARNNAHPRCHRFSTHASALKLFSRISISISISTTTIFTTTTTTFTTTTTIFTTTTTATTTMSTTSPTRMAVVAVVRLERRAQRHERACEPADEAVECSAKGRRRRQCRRLAEHVQVHLRRRDELP